MTGHGHYISQELLASPFFYYGFDQISICNTIETCKLDVNLLFPLISMSHAVFGDKKGVHTSDPPPSQAYAFLAPAFREHGRIGTIIVHKLQVHPSVPGSSHH